MLKFRFLSTFDLNKRYREVTDWLFQQFPSYQQVGAKAYKPTLENTHALLHFLGNPQDQLTFIHVAGSNGKGSVCSMTASILTEAGYRTGLFTSPHISDYRERIRIDGNCIEQESVIAFVERIQAADLSFAPSFFEVTFAMALYHFQRHQCDICVIETGLGGRLDSTNIVRPIVTAITSISLEHTQMLGDTLEAIAREKGGIIKPQIPVVLGDLPVGARSEIVEIARRQHAPISYADPTKKSGFRLPLLGAYQKANFAIVRELFNQLHDKYPVSDEQIQRGLDHLSANTGFMGRLQIMQKSPLVIYDVSHNPDGIATSLKSVQEMTRGKLHIVYGTSKDKDVALIAPLLSKAHSLFLTSFRNERSMASKDLLPYFDSGATIKNFENASKALEEAISNAAPEDTVLVTGSFFLIADLFQ